MPQNEFDVVRELGPQASTATVAITLATCAMMSITLFGGYALVFSSAPMVRAYRFARRWIEGTFALVFGAARIKLLLSRFRAACAPQKTRD